jgi:membrane protein
MSLWRRLALLGSVGLALGLGLRKAADKANAERDGVRRGRAAARPWDIPPLGWRDVFTRAWAGAYDHRILSVAAGVAFFALLSALPGLSVLMTIYGTFADPVALSGRLSTLIEIAPPAAQGIILDHARRIAGQGEGRTIVGLAVAFAVSVWSASAATKGLFDGLNVIYRETEKRSFIRFNAEALFATVAGAVMVSAALAAIAVVPEIIRAMALGLPSQRLLHALRWLALFGAGTLGIAALYWVGPSRRPARLYWVLPGALFSAVLWVAASAAFSWYVSALSAYDSLYGSLAAVAVFMTWLWMSAVIVLFGAQINAELEHQTAVDTTMGAPRPIGMRGAAVADRVGPPAAGG